jgi:hypothetical protein
MINCCVCAYVIPQIPPPFLSYIYARHMGPSRVLFCSVTWGLCASRLSHNARGSRGTWCMRNLIGARKLMSPASGRDPGYPCTYAIRFRRKFKFAFELYHKFINKVYARLRTRKVMKVPLHSYSEFPLRNPYYYLSLILYYSFYLYYILGKLPHLTCPYLWHWLTICIHCDPFFLPSSL